MADSSALNNALEFINPLDEDAGLYVGDIPFVGGTLEKVLSKQIDTYTTNATENEADDKEWLIKGAGGAAGGIVGYKLGSNFGGIGKVIGGVAGAWLGSKYSDEIVHDITAAIDYTKQNTDENDDFKTKASRFLKAASGNLFKDGQSYTGKSSEADTEEEAGV